MVGASPPPFGIPSASLFQEAARERTLPVVCRNLSISCGMEGRILARQVRAAAQGREICGRVEAIPLKGLYLAWHCYPSPSLRDLGDVDLLVRRSDLRGADGVLKKLGYVPSLEVERVAGSEGGLGAVLYHREGSLPVHLHWSLANLSLPHFMYRIDEEEVWREVRGGAMARHHLVVTLCEHALKHSYSALIYLTDVEIASRGVDWGLVAETARRWGLEGAVQYALVLLRDLMGVESPGWVHFGRVRPGWAGRILLGEARKRRWDGLSALGLLALARGWKEKVRFVRETLVPVEVEGLHSPFPAARLRRAVAMIWAGLTGRGRDGDQV